MYNNYSFCSCLFWNKVGHSMEESHTSSEDTYQYHKVHTGLHQEIQTFLVLVMCTDRCPHQQLFPVQIRNQNSQQWRRPRRAWCSTSWTKNGLLCDQPNQSSQLPTETIISVPNRTNHIITVSVKASAAHVVETTVRLLLSEWLTCYILCL